MNGNSAERTAALLGARLPWVLASMATTLWATVTGLGFQTLSVLTSGSGLGRLAALGGLLHAMALGLALAALVVLAIKLDRLKKTADAGAIHAALAAEVRYWRVLVLATLPSYAIAWILRALTLYAYRYWW